MLTMYDNSISNQKLLNFDYFNSTYNPILTTMFNPILTNECNILHIIDIIPEWCNLSKYEVMMDDFMKINQQFKCDHDFHMNPWHHEHKTITLSTKTPQIHEELVKHFISYTHNHNNKHNIKDYDPSSISALISIRDQHNQPITCIVNCVSLECVDSLLNTFDIYFDEIEMQSNYDFRTCTRGDLHMIQWLYKPMIEACDIQHQTHYVNVNTKHLPRDEMSSQSQENFEHMFQGTKVQDGRG